MEGCLFLSGGGTEKESYLLDKEFSKLLKNKLLYISIAMEEELYPECFKWIKSVFQQFDFDNIEMWVDLKNKSFDELREYDAVYIGGGNTFKLMKELRDSGFDKLLIDFYKTGGHIYGGSAGAIILGKNIITASKDDVNKVNLEDMRGLNLCNDYSILCHYTSKYDEFVYRLIEEYGIKVIALQENSGVIIKNQKIIPVGYGKVYIFEDSIKRELSISTKVL